MLSKHYFVALNSDDPDEYLPDGDCRYILNLIPKNEVSESPSRETLKGTSEITIDLPSGTNKCIGHVIDTKNDKILLFIYNSDPNSVHTIACWGENDTQAQILIQARNLFDLDPAYPITHAEVIDGTYLTWTNGNGPVKLLTLRYDEVNSGYDMDYTDMDIMVNLQKVAPYFLPTTQMTRDANNEYNLISDINFQFAYRYVFYDNSTSIFSPISDLNKAYLVPFSFNPASYMDLYNNGYRVYVRLYRRDFYKMIKNVEFAVRDGNYGQWRVFDTRSFTDPNPYGETTPENRGEITTITANFQNKSFEYYIPDAETLKPFESIPTKSGALAFVDGRIILTEDQTGLDFDNNYDLEINPVTYDVAIESVELKPTLVFKEGEAYSIGIVFSDGKQKSAVKSVTTLSIGRELASNDYQINGAKLKGVRVSLDGNFPSWATDFQFFRTPGQVMDNYVEFPGRILYYIAEYDPDNPPSGWSPTDIASYDPTVIDGRVYRKSQPILATDLFTYIHLQVPKNLPIEINNGYYLRPLKNYLATHVTNNHTFQVIDVVDDNLVLNKIPSVVSYASTFPNGVMFVEAFKQKINSNNNIFYACSDIYKTSEAQSTYDLWGDTHVVYATYNILKYIYNPLTKESTSDWISYFFFSDQGNYGLDSQYYAIESPTPVYGSDTISTLQFIETQKIERKDSLTNSLFAGLTAGLFNPDKSIVNIERRWLPQSGFSLNYSKDDRAIGAPNVVNSNERTQYNPTVIRWSNKYVGDTLINGLSSFDAANKYVIKPERGPIIALKLVDNVLLAIHPHSITSIYIGEGYIKQADDTDIITKTEGFIGGERSLGSGLGTVFPESLVSHTYEDPDSNAKSTRLYGFDIYAAEPWRASNNGVMGLASRAKMKKWFKDKSAEYMPWITDHKSLIHIISGYDPYLKMYLITFPTVNLPAIEGHDATVIQGITVGYSEASNRWVTFLSFVPEQYVSFHNKLISVLDGVPYIHNMTENYNNFHGIDYEARVTFLCNKEYSKDKIFRAVAQESSHAIRMDSINAGDHHTFLNADEFKQKGNDFIADMPMDYYSYVVDPIKNPPRIYGKDMIGKALEVSMVIPQADEVTQITSINLAYQPIKGSLNV